AGICVAGISVAGICVAGISVAGICVAGISVAGICVAGISVAGIWVDGICVDGTPEDGGALEGGPTGASVPYPNLSPISAGMSFGTPGAFGICGFSSWPGGSSVGGISVGARLGEGAGALLGGGSAPGDTIVLLD